MNQQEKLIQHLKTKGKTHSWRELAEMFNVLPGGTTKQKSDKVRRIFNASVAGAELNFVGKAYTTRPAILEDESILVVNEKGEVLERFETIHEYKGRRETIGKKAVRHLKQKRVSPYLDGNPNNVLVIGDIHEPFCLDGYLEFCRKQQEKFDCGTIVFIGDVIDSHFSSFFPSNPDGFGAGEELERAVNKLHDWHNTFPNAVVTIGNHDRIAARKLYSSGVSARWIKPIEEVIGCPSWRFVEEYEYLNVLYIHGEGGTAKKKASDEGISCVQGHAHTEAYIDLAAGRNNQRFAMQVGTGIDFNAYAFGYAQRGKKPLLSCGVVLEGKFPILIPFQ